MFVVFLHVMSFARLLVQIIKLQTQFPNNTIKTIRLDNALEFTSQTFTHYCMSIGIKVEHPIAHTHTLLLILTPKMF